MIRKILASLVCMAVALPAIAFADDQKPISVFVDGQQLSLEVSPVIQNGTALVPIRAVFEKLGLKVTWNEETQTIAGSRDQLDIQMQVGNKDAFVNGRVVKMGVSPSIIKGSTLIPLRFVGETSGNKISWNAKNRRIDIKGNTNSTNVKD